YRLRHVVDIDVLAEDLGRRSVFLIDWSARETDEGCLRKGVADVPSEPVDHVVVRAMSLVDHYDYVASVGQQGKTTAGLPVLLRQTELLQRGEDDAARFAARK